ncbi:MAG: dTDP-4-dehydrorhamnose reductase [Pseudomonadota bacterium]
MEITTLLFGFTGQVGIELLRRAKGSIRLVCVGRDEADFTDPIACAGLIRASDADVIINVAAFTAVDNAESKEALAYTINAEAPGAMARIAAAKGIPFLHVSTDYVYDGSGIMPWRAESTTGPLSAYGRTKLAGDLSVQAAGGSHAILRTSWVFSAHGSNFVKTMLRLGAERERLTIVADQIGGPTPAASIAEALLTMARAFYEGRGQSGIYHFSGTPEVSWADFAREIFTQSGLAPVIENIPTSAYPTPAQRPLNSRLDCSSLNTTFSITRPDWRQGLSEVLRDLGVIG